MPCLRVSPEAGAAILSEREPAQPLLPDPDLPADTRLWSLLQQAGGGTWGGCVYDVDAIAELLQAGMEAKAESGEWKAGG